MEQQASKFLSTLKNEEHLVEIFDLLPDIYFYIKDRECRWVLCNQASMRLFNFRTQNDVFGATEMDLFPPSIAESIHLDDLNVINNNMRIINRVELIVGEAGYLTWVATNKIPLISKDNTLCGLMGTSRILNQSDQLPEGYQKFRKVIEFMQAHIGDKIDIEKLAEISHLSSSQFRKRFRQQFRVPPREFILRTRLQAASKLLIQSNESIVNIALKCGFTDQSYFTRQFSKFFELSPKKYRNEWAQK